MKKQANKILIVDDIYENIEIANATLCEESYSILEATSGKQAIEIVMDYIPNLILLDIMMPGLNGFDVCKILKRDTKTKDIPIIFLTAKTDEETIVQAFDVGGVDYITKPFNPAELIARVRTHISIQLQRIKIQNHEKNLESQNQLLNILNRDLHKLNQQIAEKTEKLVSSKQLIEEQNRDIISSITYAKRIQNALMPTEIFFRNYLPDHFIINIPRDIVSGDFYWMKQIADKVFFAVADCTGHGVPGAFISVLGMTLLNEIVDRKNLFQTNEILDELRKQIMMLLHQDFITKKTVHDGIDIALCSFNLDNYKLQYSGANNHLTLINKNSETNKYELNEIKADRMPVSSYVILKTFTKHDIQLEKGDLIYLYSDGFPDQFGGIKGKKFYKKRLRELLFDISKNDTETQKQILHDTFYQWKQNLSQVDDVLLVGIKISGNYGDIELF